MKLFSALPVGLICLMLSANFLSAATNGFFAPVFRQLPNSRFGYWETFTKAVGAPGNTADRPGSNIPAILSQTETNAFLTGTGNIYNMGGASSFTVASSSLQPLGTVVLQTRTIGSELDYTSVLLHYTNALGTSTLTPLPRVELDRGTQPGQGSTVSSFWQWNLSGLDVTNYVITFRATASSLSFDSMTLDQAEQFTSLFAAPFAVTNSEPDIERWMYPHNAAPCNRSAGSSFATFGDDSGVDTRFAQHMKTELYPRLGYKLAR